MAKKKEKKAEHSEIDIVMEANHIAMEKIKSLSEAIQEKYEGMDAERAHESAKNYYLFGILSMHVNPDIRKEAVKRLGEK